MNPPPTHAWQTHPSRATAWHGDATQNTTGVLGTCPRMASPSHGMESSGWRGMENILPILQPQNPTQTPQIPTPTSRPSSRPGTSQPPTPPRWFGWFYLPFESFSTLLLFLFPLPSVAEKVLTPFWKETSKLQEKKPFRADSRSSWKDKYSRGGGGWGRGGWRWPCRE